MKIEELIQKLEELRDNGMSEATIYLDTEGLPDNFEVGYLPQIEISSVHVIDEGEVGISLDQWDIDYVCRTIKERDENKQPK